jgi:DNA polymerase delta subunit 2
MEDTLAWRHLAPTAPDTLACYPFADQDPFVVKETPNVYYCGNQAAFATKLVAHPDGAVKDGADASVRLIALPVFATTGTAVLVNVATLEATPLTIGPF